MNNEHLDINALIDYLHRELDPGEDATVMQHIGTCAQCSAAYNEQAQLSESLRAYARATERELPAGVIARVRDAVEKEHAAPTLAGRLSAWLRPAIAVPAAALLALALYFGVIAPRVPATTAIIDAAYYLDDHAALTNTVPFSEGNVVPASLENDETGSDQHWVAATGASDIATR